jgi:3',5'-cyclic AMP phosphodiesterase CpdA
MLTRREVIAVSAVGALLPGRVQDAEKPKRALRLAHLTDIHVQPERGAKEGMAACLAHVQQLDDKPDLILTGGDLIMDAMGAEKDRVKAQWDIFQRVIASHNSLPIEHTIGNHDVFGWGKGDQYAADPGYGKAWACNVLGLEKPYRSFDRAGWKFIVLDSTFRAGDGYTARLDDEQFDWLASTLQTAPKETPVLIVSHIPILGVGPYLDGDNEKSGDWRVPGAWMHIDARRIKDLFLKHPNVRLCLSGHVHLVDHVIYNGVSYCCSGAVCAGWWGGDYQECTGGYSLVDLYEDGSFEFAYVPFGWTV